MITLTEQAGPPLDLTDKIQRLDQYQCDGGSFGDIYKCSYDSPSGPILVAVKVLRFTQESMGDIKETEHMLKTLHRELGIWRRLDHPNVVPFLGVASSFAEYPSLVSEWMPNGNLGVYLKEHNDRLSVGDRFRVLEGMITGLDYLHSHSIIHGDLTPSNVLLDGGLRARLVDFGFASVIGTLPQCLEYLSWATQCPGAIRWAAPERFQIADDVVFQPTTKSDVYSFGCVMLQVLSGQEPWSEIRARDICLIPVRLHQGKNPGRPPFRAIGDQHWVLIQKCWLPVNERCSAQQLRCDIVSALQNPTTLGRVRSTRLYSIATQGSITDWTQADIGGLLSCVRHSDSVIAALSSNFECAWIENGVRCGEHLTGHAELPHHLASVHGVHGTSGRILHCEWQACHKQVKRASLIRHVREVHLNVRRRCPVCSQSVVRRSVLEEHLKTHLSAP